MRPRNSGVTLVVLLGVVIPSPVAGQFAIPWYTTAGGGGQSAGGGFELFGSVGQPDTGAMSGGGFEFAGGFVPGSSSGSGVPAATIISAVSRKACNLPVTRISGVGVRSTEPRQGGITELRIAFDVAPGGPGASLITLEQANCAAPAFVPYSGASTSSAAVIGNELVLTFTPGLENARGYQVTLGPGVTGIAGQSVELRGLVGDVNGDGAVNALDRSVVVGAWTGGGFTCATDINADAATNALDRSIVVGAWTGGANCAP